MPFGFRYIRFENTRHVIRYQNGKIRQEGRGLSFWYFAPITSIVAIPVGSNDAPFIFTLTTTDAQTVTVQGQITYQISNPKQLAELLDFTVDAKGLPLSDDHDKLTVRLVNEAQTATTAFVAGMTIKQTLISAKAIEERISEGLKSANAIKALGVTPLSVVVLAVKPTPEMARALEAQTREALQQEADLAIYQRRNFAVEQERKIRESELQTEIAVEEKHKQIAEKRNESEVLAAENDRRLRDMRQQTEIELQEKRLKADLAVEASNRRLRETKLEADIAIEAQRKNWVTQNLENERKLAEHKLEILQKTLELYKGMDWKTIMAMNERGNNPGANIAIAFREMAEKADRIGNLNISPDLLNSLIENLPAQPKPPARPQSGQVVGPAQSNR